MHARGALQAAAALQLSRALDQALEQARLLIVDLSGLTFIDGTGLWVLVRADAQARLQHRRLVLVRVPAHVRRLIELTGLSPRLEVSELRPVIVETTSDVTTSAPATAAVMTVGEDRS